MALLRMSLLKLVRRPATWVVFLIVTALSVATFVMLGAFAGQVESVGDRFQIRLLLEFPTAYSMVIAIVLGFGGLLAAAYGAAVVGADWAWGTIRAIVARGEGRVRYTLVTFLAIALVLGVGVVASFAIGSLAAVAGASMAGLPLDGATEPSTLASLPEMLARTWLGVVQQAAVGVAIAMVFRSQLAGIGAAIALYFAESFLVFMPVVREFVIYGPFSVAGAVVPVPEAFGTGGFGDLVTLDADTALAWSVGYLVLALAVASLFAWRAQITQ